ncbi:type IA DNA topoisomerase [Jeotgalibaca porci]|uniref:type IA DNA topoisomerase n=1 Tax=Jeotgalibaca porci TaxID=1868793 RepID=UPI001D03625B|nr:type IA DNA topoisomerase [Jeotgalibaca porci]
MGYVLILAEKPSQASAYADAFDYSERKDGYFIVSDNEFSNAVITYGFGHLVSLFSPEDYTQEWKKWNLQTLPLLPTEYQFKVSEGKKKQYMIVKKHLDEADTIIIATDGDREGEAIARLIINLSGNSQKQLKRLWINSLEKVEIKNGFRNLRNGEAFYSSYKEAETRQIADWLVGMNLSRLYTLYMQKNGMKGVFSIGRVQTPTLYLIYQRNKEIAAFVSKPFFELYGNFRHEKGVYQGKYAERFDSEADLEAFKEKHSLSDSLPGQITSVKTEEKKQYAPKLFSLSDLQAVANKRFNYGASETLKIVQGLYEKKLISYPRTDTNYIGRPEFDYLKTSLSSYLNLVKETIDDPQLKENKRYVNGAKVQEHYAIIPTRTLPQLAKLSQKERNMYELILYRTLSIFEKPYVYDETTIETTVHAVLFKTTGKVEKTMGWRKFYKHKKESTQSKEANQTLPAVKEGEAVVSHFLAKEGKTQPPKYYTEGTLITAMKNVGRDAEDEDNKVILKETEGIGTEATRASVIETLKKQDYITLQKNDILVTTKGETLCEVIQHDEIANATMTAKWEKYLKKIRNHEGTQEAFLNSITNFIRHLIQKVPGTFETIDIKTYAEKGNSDTVIGVCPQCQKDIIDKGKFFGCTGYREGCSLTLPKKWSGKTLTKKNIKDLLVKQETSLIKGFKSKKDTPFNAKLKLVNNKLAFDFPNPK